MQEPLGAAHVVAHAPTLELRTRRQSEQRRGNTCQRWTHRLQVAEHLLCAPPEAATSPLAGQRVCGENHTSRNVDVPLTSTIRTHAHRCTIGMSCSPP